MDKTVRQGSVAGEVTPPSSKSYAQRAIAAALLAEGVTTLQGVELCDDTVAAFRVVECLGAKVERTADSTYTVCGGLNPTQNLLNIGESGLSTRLFTPIAALCNIPITITGHGSIMRRPINMMTAPLEKLGVEVHCKNGVLPVTVRGPIHGGRVEIDGRVSSQFLTGLLTALPKAKEDTTIYVDGLKSTPYVDMTIATAQAFGVDIEHRDYQEFYIAGGQSYTPTTFNIEGDWSGASCMLAAAATVGSLTLHNLSTLSIQADVAILRALIHAGAEVITAENRIAVHHKPLTAFEFDATACPDLFPALAALAAACEGTSTIKGTSRLTTKESNRAETITSELGQLGIQVDISTPDVMRISGAVPTGGVVNSHGDHRIAMMLAVVALRADSPVTITGAECVSKSYKDFWTDFEKIVQYE